jgi:hypothetical protein
MFLCLVPLCSFILQSAPQVFPYCCSEFAFAKVHTMESNDNISPQVDTILPHLSLKYSLHSQDTVYSCFPYTSLPISGSFSGSSIPLVFPDYFVGDLILCYASKYLICFTFMFPALFSPLNSRDIRIFGCFFQTFLFFFLDRLAVSSPCTPG